MQDLLTNLRLSGNTFEQVAEFHEFFEFPIPEGPVVPSTEIAELRAKFIEEEGSSRAVAQKPSRKSKLCCQSRLRSKHLRAKVSARRA